MRKNFTILFCFTLLLCANHLFAQDRTETESSIDDQFDSLFENSNNYKNYEVVERNSLLQLQQNTKLKIAELNQKIDSSGKLISKQEQEISQLQLSLDNTSADLSQATQAKAEIVFLGMALNKTTYRFITWGIIVILAIVLFILLYKFRSSNHETKEAKSNLAEMEIEFEEYRKTALEKQQKLGRMLQDERNKLARSAQK